MVHGGLLDITSPELFLGLTGGGGWWLIEEEGEVEGEGGGHDLCVCEVGLALREGVARHRLEG